MKTHELKPHVLELACPPLPVVRIGLIGVGQRGLKALRRYADIEGTEICVVADLDAERLAEANRQLQASGRPVADVEVGEQAWQSVCRRDDVDLVYICTEWDSHAAMAVAALGAGKHVAVEVPAATSVSECWQLVDAAESARRHCFMLENCCYDSFALHTLALARQGQLGHITHCEGAYIHNLRDTFGLSGRPTDTLRTWMERRCALHGGNPYPTHGMGPMAQLLGLHRGDRLDYLVSMTTQADGADGILGKVNTTLLRTVGGAGIVLQLDLTTPRPYSRLQTVCGTGGYCQKYPLPTVQLVDMPEALTGDDALHFLEPYTLSAVEPFAEEGRRKGVDNVMNYTMDARLIYCLRHGLPLDIDVYDAAEWSCIAELSEQSAREGSRPVAVPDFTRGRWREFSGHRFHVVGD